MAAWMEIVNLVRSIKLPLRNIKQSAFWLSMQKMLDHICKAVYKRAFNITKYHTSHIVELNYFRFQ